MKKIFAVVITLMILSSSAFAVYQTYAPNLKMFDNLVTQTKFADGGKIISNKTLKIKKVAYADETIITSTLKDKGLTEDEKPYTATTITTYSLKDQKLTFHKYTTNTYIDGKLAQKDSLIFDWKKKKAYFKKEDLIKNKTKTKTHDIDAKTVPARSSSFYYQDIIRKKIKEDTFTLIAPDGDTFSMKVKVFADPEVIKTNAEAKKCIKIEMKPDLGLLSMILPTLSFWYDAEPPHEFIRYSGLQKGLGSAHIIENVIK